MTVEEMRECGRLSDKKPSSKGVVLLSPRRGGFLSGDRENWYAGPGIHSTPLKSCTNEPENKSTQFSILDDHGNDSVFSI